MRPLARPSDPTFSKRDINLFVGGLHNAPDLVGQHGITHVISLLDPVCTLPNLGLHHSCHRAFTMIDTEDRRAVRAPQEQQVREILEFARALPTGARLLIHCHAGISRSSACALAVLAQRYGLEDPQRLSDVLTKQVCTNPIPNLLIAQYADGILEMTGRLTRLAAQIGSAALKERHGILIQRSSAPGL